LLLVLLPLRVAQQISVRPNFNWSSSQASMMRWHIRRLTARQAFDAARLAKGRRKVVIVDLVER